MDKSSVPLIFTNAAAEVNYFSTLAEQF